MNALDFNQYAGGYLHGGVDWPTGLSKPPRPPKSAQKERESRQAIETPSEVLNPLLRALYSTSRQAEQLEKECNMQLLSREAELELLEKVGDHLEKRLELEKQHNDGWDLIARADLLEKLGISGTTLNNWEKHGLKPYQSPFENSKKIYYRKTDIYNFLAVD